MNGVSDKYQLWRHGVSEVLTRSNWTRIRSAVERERLRGFGGKGKDRTEELLREPDNGGQR